MRKRGVRLPESQGPSSVDGARPTVSLCFVTNELRSIAECGNFHRLLGDFGRCNARVGAAALTGRAPATFSSECLRRPSLRVNRNSRRDSETTHGSLFQIASKTKPVVDMTPGRLVGRDHRPQDRTRSRPNLMLYYPKILTRLPFVVGAIAGTNVMFEIPINRFKRKKCGIRGT